MIALSARVQAIAPSATFAIKAKAAALRAEGVSVIDLSAGEPDGYPPEGAAAAGVAAIEAGEHRYGPVAGLPALREAIARSYDRFGLTYTAGNVLVTVGGKHALFNLAQALLNEGDEVIVFAPYWVSYIPQIELAGGRVVVVPTRSEDGFQPDLTAVEEAITPRTRAMIVNSPSNPTGCLIEPERLAALDQLADEHSFVVISDEIYASLTFGGAQSSCFPTLSEQAVSHTVIVDAVSKTFAMTGWRVGWMVGPKELIAACSKLQGHSTSGVSKVNQLAALGALTASRSFLEPVREALMTRRNLLADGLAAIEGIDPGPLPGGAFYLFPRVDGLFGRRTPRGEVLDSAMTVARFLLEEGGVAVVPGEAFGESRCVRVSYALSREEVQEGMNRIAAAVARLD